MRGFTYLLTIVALVVMSVLTGYQFAKMQGC